MTDTKYYGLVASLPRLVHFERAEYVPITAQQLDSRLRGLDPDHKQQLDAAVALMLWQRQPREPSTGYLVERYGRTVEVVTNARLHDFIEYRMGLRTVVIALRMRRRGESPRADTPWGVGRWARKVAAHWDDTDFAMGNVFPWLTEARAHVEATNALALERLLLDQIWLQLDTLESTTPFGFERIAAFVFKWDIVKRWLSYDADGAKQRFQALITEVIRDHERLFA